MLRDNFVIPSASQFKTETSTALAICKTIDSPRSLMLKLLIENEEWDQVSDLSIEPSHYKDPSNFASDYLVTELLRKSPNLPLETDRYQVAVDNFLLSEQRCKVTNDRLIAGDTHELMGSVVYWISKILGPLDRTALQFIEGKFGFGPGATTGVPGRGSVLSDKYDEEIHLTESLYPFYKGILGERWWDHRRTPEIVSGNKFATVPKTAKTDRGICVEPTLNVYVQKGIGAYIRKRLKRFGFDLDSQDKNRLLAKAAWNQNLATIDLEAASDSLSYVTVLHCLPSNWFNLLEIARSPVTKLGDNSIVLEKFSSMGNGYTFELESLIFAATVLASTHRKEREIASVFGDDIIVPQTKAPTVIELLKFLGFSVNSSKSFLAGSFYESCGHDYFMGINVRPFYLKGKEESKSDGLPYTLQIANKLRLWLARLGGGMGCDEVFRPIWNALYLASPYWSRPCLVPPEFGDTGFIVSQRENLQPKSRDGLHGWFVRHLVFKPYYRDKRSFGLLLSALSGLTSSKSKHFKLTLFDDVMQRKESLLSYGREPKRGFLREPSTKLGQAFSWPSGLEWTSFH